MKLSPSDQESLITLLGRLHREIGEIEAEFALVIGKGDFRPRIDYFHDAVQAFFTEDTKALANGGRLSVEFLAYDLRCLRYIESMPLAPFIAGGGAQSASFDMLSLGDGSLAAKPKRPNRAVRERLVDLYRHYGVLYAALLKPCADQDYEEQSENLVHDSKDLTSILVQLEALTHGKGSKATTIEAINHVEDEQLRQELTAFFQQAGSNKQEALRKMINYLKNHRKKKEATLKTIETAHTDYAMNQLAIYESSRELLKKMATQGMNLVGKFVEASIAKTRREMGR